MAIVTESPRFEDKTFKWYVGDTFTLTFNITFKVGQTVQENLNFSSANGTDFLTFEFYDKKKTNILTYKFGKDFENGPSAPTTPATGDKYYVFNLVFDEDITTKFAVGGYTFCATYEKETERTTVIGRGAIEVESCH